MITVDDSGENTIVVASGANSLVSIEDVRRASSLIEECDGLVLQLEIPMATNVEAARIARASSKPVVLNAAPARSLPPDLLNSVDVLVVNRHEAATLTGQDPHVEPGRLALRLPDLGPPAVLLTLGAQGSILAHKGRVRRVPTPRVHAVDSVGAGDAFVAALAVGWVAVHHAARVKSHDEFKLAEEAALKASAAGALATTKPGAIPSLPRRDEVDALAATLKIGA
jgi:ribokinase